MKKNLSFWVIVFFMQILQGYFFKYNSIIHINCPELMRLDSINLNSNFYPLEYLALMAPIIILMLYFVEWEDFYIDSYGVLQIARNANLNKYMMKIYGKIGFNVLIYIFVGFLINCFFDFEYIVSDYKTLFLFFGDYYIAIFDICAFVFLLCMILKKEIATVASIVSMIAIVLISRIIEMDVFDQVLFFTHIIKRPKYNVLSSFIVTQSFGFLWIAVLYFTSVVVIRKKEFIRRDV